MSGGGLGGSASPNCSTSQNTLTLFGLDSRRKIGEMSPSCKTLKPVFPSLVSEG